MRGHGEQSQRSDPWDQEQMPGRMTQSYATPGAEQACPCGSGSPNSECHCVREIDYLTAAPPDERRPQLSARRHPLSSDPRAYSSGIATRCHGCGAVLTVGLGFGDGNVVIVCDCGARNEAPHDRPAATAHRAQSAPARTPR